MLLALRLEDFSPLLDQNICFRAADGTFDLRLVEAAALAQPSPRPHPAFRLILQSGTGLRLPQGTFALEHPQHGTLELFMVPIQPDAGGTRYEVIFN